MASFRLKSGAVVTMMFALFFSVHSFSSNSSHGAEKDKKDVGKQIVARCNSGTFKGRRSLYGTVERVVDGDTIILRMNDRTFNIRFLGIDTPEKFYLGKSQGYWADKASAYLAGELAAGTPVRVELDQETCDRYGRVLGHVWHGKTLINSRIVREGLAVNYCIWPNLRHCREYGRHTARAMREKLGMYSDGTTEIPYEWRRLQSGRDHDKFVGDLTTRRVYQPDQIGRVSMGNRVFFFREEDVKPPFRMVR